MTTFGRDEQDFELRVFTIWQRIESMKHGARWKPVIADIRVLIPSVKPAQDEQLKTLLAADGQPRPV